MAIGILRGPTLPRAKLVSWVTNSRYHPHYHPKTKQISSTPSARLKQIRFPIWGQKKIKHSKRGLLRIPDDGEKVQRPSNSIKEFIMFFCFFSVLTPCIHVDSFQRLGKQAFSIFSPGRQPWCSNTSKQDTYKVILKMTIPVETCNSDVTSIRCKIHWR